MFWQECRDGLAGRRLMGKPVLRLAGDRSPRGSFAVDPDCDDPKMHSRGFPLPMIRCT